jgi:uncharacterized protein (TIGR00661 family)
MQIIGKTVLIAPLNWGLGHATRCMVIIDKLLLLNCKVIVASDGAALTFLKREYPTLTFLELPGYNITYSKTPSLLKLKLALQSFFIYQVIRKEHKLISDCISDYDIDLIISDNRFGVFSNKVPCIYITHQLQVLSGFTTWLTSKIHQGFIKKFSGCWVPDLADNKSLAGNLAYTNNLDYKKIGVLTRLQKTECVEDIDVLFLISGPEPQRSILEQIFLEEIKKNTNYKIVLIKGKVENEQKIEVTDLLTVYNFANSIQINELLNRSKHVVCRSGYSTIMDLSVLQKKALLIPTPGQNEQEYLAKYLQEQEYLPFVVQDKFRFELIKMADNYKGLPIGKPLDDVMFLKLFTDL